MGLPIKIFETNDKKYLFDGLSFDLYEIEDEEHKAGEYRNNTQRSYACQDGSCVVGICSKLW